MALTEAQALAIARAERARGEYQEITVRDCGDYGFIVTGRKVVNGQGIGRTWNRIETEDDRLPIGEHSPVRDGGGLH
jgi:hypothetical protein